MEDFVVAITYPIQEITPRIPPIIIRIVNCKTIGLQSESIKRYAYTKNADIDRINIKMPRVLRFDIALNTSS